MRALSSLVVVLLGASVVFARELPTAPPLAAAALESHIEYLASDELEGREAGTEGGALAESYITQALSAAGLDAVEEQDFAFVAGAELGDSNRLVIAGREIPREDFRPLALSGSAKGTWKVAFAGFGVSSEELERDDYAKIDVKECVVVVLPGTPDGKGPHGKFAEVSTARAKALTAVEKGASALIVLVSVDDHGKETLPSFNGRGVSRDVGIPVLALKTSVAKEALGIEFETGEGETRTAAPSRTVPVSATIETEIKIERRSSENVLGWLRARHPEAVDELVVIGAHHDHLGRGTVGSLAGDRRAEIHNGADDNASGVAGVLELARALAPRAAELRRHVLFMTFGAEEWGLLGSKHFKEKPILRLPAAEGVEEVAVKPVAMLNMDMVGRMRGGALFVSGVSTSEAWPELLETLRALRHPNLDVKLDGEKNIMGSSDHLTFYQMGVPVLFFFTGSHPQYHRPDDDVFLVKDDGSRERLINTEGLESLLRYAMDVAVVIANRREPPPYAEGIDLAPRMSFPVVLRLMPSYGADVEGMKVENITPDGPAALGGIKAGDIITRFGSTPVRSVRDYMVGLQKARPNEKVEVEVTRGEKKLKLTVIPAGRAPAH